MMMMSSLFLLILLALNVDATTLMEDRTYVVYMDQAKVPSSYQNIRQWYEDLLITSVSQEASQDQDAAAAAAPRILYAYETVVSGFAARLSGKQLEALRELDGFLAAIPDEMLSVHTTHSPQFLGLHPGKGLWDLRLASDVIIGVLDTGVWPEHVSFRDEGLKDVPSRWKGQCENGTRFAPANCNKKLIGARAFFKGYEALVGRINETREFRSPRDSNGHGTHTASTAGGYLAENANLFGLGNGTAAGMKYSARLAVYKVCWNGGCTSADLMAAIDQAAADGVDILSMSLGGVFAKPFYADNLAIASFGATQKGIFVSCSAGNSGPSASSVDNAAPWIMTVAASYTDRSFPTTVHLGNGKSFTGSSLYVGKPTEQRPLIYAGNAGSIGAKFCISGTLKKKLVKGKIVVCEKGLTGRASKGLQVKLAGGAGMLLINNVADGEESLADAHVLPASALGAKAGIAVKKYLNSTNAPTASISFLGTKYGDPAPVMAGFSSRGPSSIAPEVIKPDITAPGVNILAAWPPETSPTQLEADKRRVLFHIISGTSMSCPHVAGIAALLKSVHKDWSPAAIKSAMMTTAYTHDTRNNPIPDIAPNNLHTGSTPFAFGSGHVAPEMASDPGLIYDIAPQDYLNFLCSINYTSSQVAIVTRTNSTCPNTGQKPHSGDLNYPSFAVNFKGTSSKSTVTHKRTVTNVGVPSSSYVVKVETPVGVTVNVEPKTLTFRSLKEKLSYTVRFSGVGGKDRRGSSSFGSIVWVSGKYSVRSPIAVTWQ